MSTTDSPSTTEAGAETQALIVELAITAHKHGMYPRDHPQLRVAAEGLSDHLGPYLAERGSLAIGVAMDGLMVAGSPPQTPPPMVADFARQLRDHQIGSITLFEGIGWSELERLFSALEADAASQPASDAGSFGPNIMVRSAGYDRLHLDEVEALEPDLADPEALWAELAQAVLDDPAGSDASVDAMAAAIDRAERPKSGLRHVAGCLGRIIDNLAARGRAGRDHPVRARVSDLLRRVRSPALANLLAFDSDKRARASVLRAAGHALPGDVLAHLLTAAADAAQQDISRSVLRLLQKISTHQDARDLDLARLARAEVQEGLQGLLEAWQLTDPNPQSYNALLDEVAYATAEPASAAGSGRIGADERLLRICLDLDHWSETADHAVDRLLDAGQAEPLLDLLGQAAPGAAARGLADRALTPRLLQILTAGDTVDRHQLDRVARTMGGRAIDPLLDALAESPSRTMRRTVFDALAGLGPDVGPPALERARDDRWFVRRNMLALVGKVGVIPAGFPLLDFMTDPDSRVRIQTLGLAAGHADAEEAFVAGLDDDEQRVVAAALRNLPETVPPALSGRLARIAQSDATEPTRLLAVRAMGRIQDAQVRQTLVDLASRGRSWLGRIRVRNDAVGIEAVRGLARHWQSARDVRPVLRAAAKAKDSRLRAAAGVSA